MARPVPADDHRKAIAAIVGYVRATLINLSRHFPVVFAMVSMVYWKAVVVDYKAFDRISDCNMVCHPEKPQQNPNGSFHEKLTIELSTILSSSNPCLDLQPYIFAMPAVDAMASPSLFDVCPLSASHVYLQHPEVLACLAERDDCDVLLTFCQANLSVMPPITDPKYWPVDTNSDHASMLDRHDQAKMLYAKDLVAHLQAHALNITRSAKFLMHHKFASKEEYAWIYPSIRVQHMTLRLLRFLESFNDIASITMSSFNVEYSTFSEATSPGRFHHSDAPHASRTHFNSSAITTCLLNASVCDNCYYERGITLAPCLYPKDEGFKPINCQDALDKNVSFNCYLMKALGSQLCTDKVLPKFPDCYKHIFHRIGHSKLVNVPGVENLKAPDYLLSLLGSDAASFLNPSAKRSKRRPVIASFDSGVDFTNILVRDSYRGFVESTDGVVSHTDSWFSAHGLPFPVDLRDHGTKALSVALGGSFDRNGDYVALGAAARHATWIALTCDSGKPELLQEHLSYLRAFEWLLELNAKGKGADVILMPIKAQEGFSESFLALYGAIESLKDLSIVVTGLGSPQATDNPSEWCYTALGHPPSFEHVVTVGAVTNNRKHSQLNVIGGFAKQKGIDGLFFDSDIVKPNVVTFGEGIICASLEPEFTTVSMGGTSLSAALLAGVLAHFPILYPNLDFDNYREALSSSSAAVPNPLDNAGNARCPIRNNMSKYFGAGLLDATALNQTLLNKSQLKAMCASTGNRRRK